jgi:hypothetical protein
VGPSQPPPQYAQCWVAASLNREGEVALKDTSMRERESSLHVTNTTYSGLQEHRIIVYTATGQKAKPKVPFSTESTVTGNSSKTLEACRRETEEHKLKTAV